ncbi:MAG: HD domain-containing protein [Peptococcaceae bacterium]|nr:HD domain-containing protein [Peptococcaceae bacterium]
MTTLIDDICLRMIAFDRGDAKRIQHFLKVHRFAQLIGRGEGLDEGTQFILEAAALVHDIGIHPAEEKFGDCSGKLQEQEGPAPARALLTEAGVDAAAVDRICYLVAHHHTYKNVDGDDYQILIEADFLVNMYEDDLPSAAVRHAYENIFRTATGRRLCELCFATDGSNF